VTTAPAPAALRAIAAAVAPHVVRTPLLRAAVLDELAGCEVWLKAELFQHTGAYKVRGMTHALSLLDAEQRARGVITFSAGNAAQGLAWAARTFGCKAVTVMPAKAVPAKVAATKALGAETILHGTAKDAFALMQDLIARHGYHYVPPSDHPDMIAGNASMGLEIAEDAPDADTVVVPIGGGGMISGVAMGLRAAGHAAAIYGVEPEGACVMAKSLAAGQPVDLDQPPQTVADGLAYPFGGRYTYPVVRDLVRQVLVLDDAAILSAMFTLMTRSKLYVEPSGAAGLAGLLALRSRGEAVRKAVVVVSGGNLDLNRLRELLPPA
jgi:threonine dehydratase